MIKKVLYRILMLTILILSLSACMNKVDTTNDKQLTFDEFIEKIFREDVTRDLMTYVLMVENPASFGLTDYCYTIDTYTQEFYSETIKNSEERLEQLLTYEYSTLSTSQMVEYDLLKESLEIQIAAKDCYYYLEPLSPLNGEHIIGAGNISIYATRYFESLEQKEDKSIHDIENYFEIYKAMGGYFNNIALFEREKANQGLFMSAQNAVTVQQQCIEVINNDAASYGKGFEEEVKKITWISEEDRDSLLKTNKESVKKYILPGYQLVADTMNELKKLNQGKGLFETENGRKYYEILLKQKTSTNYTPEEVFKRLETNLAEWESERSQLINEMPNIQNETVEVANKWISAEDIIRELNEKVKQDFPNIDILWGTKDMPSEMNGFAAGLFNPPTIDSTVTDQNVYLGTLYDPGTQSYINILAHEGVPGHLYHFEYMKTLKLSNYRMFKTCSSSYLGYLEGYTTYIEELSYRYTGFSDKQARILQLNRLQNIGIISYIDIGVNYYGWGYTEIAEAIEKYAPQYMLASGQIKYTVECSPAMASSYAVGYIEMRDILELLNNKNGGDMEFKDLMSKYLEVGPATFNVLRKYLNIE